MEFIKIVVICIIAGCGAGLGTGFAGLSAAVVISPMLVTFLDMNPYEAIGIALASDVLASGISAYTYGKNDNVDIKGSKSLFVSVLIFTVVGAILAHQVPPVTMGNLTVYMSLLMGINFLVKSSKEEEEEKEKKEYTPKVRKMLPIVCGALIGTICGFIGAGGGIMMLILLTTVLQYELKTAVGTSVFIMTFTALFGATSHFVLEGIMPDPLVFSVCVISTLIFALLGSKFANKTEQKKLYRVTGIVLSVLGSFMIFFS